MKISNTLGIALIIITFLLGCSSPQPNQNPNKFSKDTFLKRLRGEKVCDQNGIGIIQLRDNDYKVREALGSFRELEPGGVGHELLLNNGAITVRCRNNMCDMIKVSKGWDGETERGIRFGCSVSEFRNAYPEAKFKLIGYQIMWLRGYRVDNRLFKFGISGRLASITVRDEF